MQNTWKNVYLCVNNSVYIGKDKSFYLSNKGLTNEILFIDVNDSPEKGLFSDFLQLQLEQLYSVWVVVHTETEPIWMSCIYL